MGTIVIAYFFLSGKFLGGMPVTGHKYMTVNQCHIYMSEEIDKFNDAFKERIPDGVSVVFRCEGSREKVAE